MATPPALPLLPETQDELDRIRAECRKMVRRRAAASGGAALLPIPGVDLAADTGLLMELLPAINRKFGLTPVQIEALDTRNRLLVYALIRKASGVLVGQIITRELVLAVLKKIGLRIAARQAVKVVPIAGQAAAAALSVAAMIYVGDKHIRECYTVARGTLRD